MFVYDPVNAVCRRQMVMNIKNRVSAIGRTLFAEIKNYLTAVKLILVKALCIGYSCKESRKSRSINAANILTLIHFNK